MFYFELNEMSDKEMISVLKNKIKSSDNWQKFHVMVYSVLCKRHGDKKAYEIMQNI